MSTEDKVIKWRLPVEVDEVSGDYYIQLPDDLLEAANLKEGDSVYWTDNNNGSYSLTKKTEPLGMDEC
jgi:bifunctional DNA-binding transcriptional regulator/antitoxin component of YhaV-PrlF toxin-antitoxin module